MDSTFTLGSIENSISPPKMQFYVNFGIFISKLVEKETKWQLENYYKLKNCLKIAKITSAIIMFRAFALVIWVSEYGSRSQIWFFLCELGTYISKINQLLKPLFPYINPCSTNVSLLYPPKTSEPPVFWRFQGVEKRTISSKWVNAAKCTKK